MEKEKEGKKIINVNLEDESVEEDGEEGEVTDAVAGTDAGNSNSQSEDGAANISNKKTFKISRALKDILAANNNKFMKNFDPELSNREKRKLTRKINVEGKKNDFTNDENVAQNIAERDVCDCLNEDCPGCHFPCPKCRSCKCGVECRVNRKWVYESIKNESEMLLTKNASNTGS